jgi:hypothetical protein
MNGNPAFTGPTQNLSMNARKNTIQAKANLNGGDNLL